MKVCAYWKGEEGFGETLAQATAHIVDVAVLVAKRGLEEAVAKGCQPTATV